MQEAQKKRVDIEAAMGIRGAAARRGRGKGRGGRGGRGKAGFARFVGEALHEMWQW